MDTKSDASRPAVERGESRADLQGHTEQLRQLLVDSYQAGETVKALAAEFELHHQAVRAAVVEAGVEVRTRQRLTHEQLARAREAYEAGQTTTEIGDALGVYASTIGRALVRLGVTLRPASRRAASD